MTSAPDNVLLVDDRPENLFALEEVLRPLGHNLVTAASGEEALKLLLKNDFAVILLDVQMPGMDGFETALRIKKRDRSRRTPVIFLTAISCESHHQVRGYEAGAVDYVAKPFDPSVLRSKVATFVQLDRMNRSLEQQAAELTRSNGELQQLAEVASHDLRSPLCVISGYLELLSEECRDQPEGRAQEYIRRASETTEFMLRLVGDLLSYAAVGAEAPSECADCGTAFQTALTNLETAINHTGASVSAGPLPVVTGDPVQLVQIFQNLIANALAYRSEAAPAIEVSAESTPEGWLFAVHDNGVGIPPDAEEEIFKMFRRVPPTNGVRGTGMGLAICQRIVQRHGGRIWAEPGSAGGSIFWFTLPAA